jgi:putative PIN family toxin of toxin-antitoxin system
MRVLLDTNILVSYLLLPRGPIQTVVDAAISGAYELLMPEELLDELTQTIAARDSLRNRIPSDLLIEFINELKIISTEIPIIDVEIQPITKDPKDDFLLAYALAGEADILVSGDDDLLVLGRVDNLSFLSPADFARLLETGP